MKTTPTLLLLAAGPRRAAWLVMWLVMWVVLVLAAGLGATHPAWAQGAGHTITVGPMTAQAPAGWAPLPGQQRPNIAQFTLPGQQGLVNVLLTRTPPQKMWADLQAMVGAPQQQGSGRSGRFDWVDMRVINTLTKQPEWHRLFSTVVRDDVLLVVSMSASSQQAYVQAIEAIESMLAAARFETSAAAAATPSQQAAAAAPTAPTGAVPIVEAHVRVDVRAVTATSNVLTDHILFFGNGIVAREGVINGPRECYVLYDVRNLTRLPLNYGRWREDQGVVSIQWQEGPPWTLKREAGRRLSLNGKLLLALRPLDGLQFEGLYEYRPVGDPPARLQLFADGRFEATNLKERMGCPMQAPPGALAGSGRYEVRQWTLILRFADGRNTLLPLHVESGEDLRQVGRFWLNGHDFVRLR